MSVLFETSLGDIIVDLETIKCPTVSLNFLKLCKSYYYNFCLFHNVIPNFIAQTGDPTGNGGGGGNSIWYNLPKNSADFQSEPFFKPPRKELGISTRLKHDSIGTLSMAMSSTSQQEGGDGIGGIGSQFFFTLGNNENENLDYLDDKHVVFGKVIEGFETLTKINQSLLDQQGKPLRDIRIRHVIVLDDPFPDPQGLNIPPNSPVPTRQQLESMRVGEDEDLENEQEDPETFEKKKREHEAKAQALTLEMVGDLPFADVAPPENVLFVCKLNQVTSSEDLELIFSRFGEILSCEIIRDSKTGDSLQYAFIEFKERESAEKAYVKMDNVLVDDRRIHVDFSQSVSKLHNSWVFDKTGGRPPPNKHHTGRRGGDDGDSGLVFDMEEIDTRNNRNDTTTTSRRDRDRRGDHRQHERGGSDSKRRNYERERSPRGGANRDRDRDRDRYDQGRRDRDRDRDRDRRR